jgi:hypothetical protein
MGIKINQIVEWTGQLTDVEILDIYAKSGNPLL